MSLPGAALKRGGDALRIKLGYSRREFLFGYSARNARLPIQNYFAGNLAGVLLSGDAVSIAQAQAGLSVNKRLAGAAQASASAAANLSTAAQVALAGMAQASAAATANLSIDGQVALAGVAQASVLAAAGLSQEHVFAADGIFIGAAVLGSPALAQDHAFAADGIFAGAPALDSPALTQEHALTANGIFAGAALLGSPSLSSGAGGGATAQEVWEYEIQPGLQAQVALLDAYNRARALYGKYIGPV